MTNDLTALLHRAARQLRDAGTIDDDLLKTRSTEGDKWRATADDLDAAAEAGPAPGPLLDLAEAAAYLRRGTSTLRRDVATGALRAFRPGRGGAALIFRRDDLDAFLQPVQPPARARAVAEQPAGYTSDQAED